MVNRDPAQGTNDPTRTTTGMTGTSTTGTGVTGTTTTGTTDTHTTHGDVTGYGAETTGEQGGMKDKVAGAASTVTDAAGTAKERAAEMAGTAKERVSDAAGTATQTIDAQRDTVAGSLDTVATTLRDRAEQIPGGDKTTQIAQTAADKIETASSYLREKEVGAMMSDVESFVRSHPTESLVIALAAGFLLGRAMRG